MNLLFGFDYAWLLWLILLAAFLLAKRRWGNSLGWPPWRRRQKHYAQQNGLRDLEV